MPKNSQSLVFNPNIKILAFPIVALIILILLMYQTVTISLERVKKVQNEEVDTKRKIAVLDQKLDILTQIQSRALDAADTSLLALPNQNPALWTFQQIKDSMTNHNIVLTQVDFKFADTTAGVTAANTKIELVVEGTQSDIFSFLDDTKNSLPVGLVDSIESEARGQGQYTIAFSFFDAPLPEKLPALTEPITSLTEQEEAVLREFSAKLKPEFTKLEPDFDQEREDPFQ